MKLWKVLGVAGLAGVAATGVVIARGERRRRAYEPEDVRARLRERHAEAMEAGGDTPTEPVRPTGGRTGCLPPWATLGRRPWRRR